MIQYPEFTEPLRWIPVYRFHQFTLDSPCRLGNPCRTCAPHRHCFPPNRQCRDCRHNSRPECLRATIAAPAFTIVFRQARMLVDHGLAVFILRNTALQLTFSRLSTIRDLSSKADQELIDKCITGDHHARHALQLAWGIPPHILQEMLPAQPIYPFI